MPGKPFTKDMLDQMIDAKLRAPPPMPQQAVDPQQGRKVLKKVLGAAKKNA